MAFSKRAHYRKDIQFASDIFKALSFPGRLEILIKLQKEGPLCVQDLAKGHPISMQTFSEHLKVLREVHLIVAVESFPYTFYSVHEKNLKKAKEILYAFFKLLNV